jgi:lysophospholipase L1-like esterase
VSYVYTPPYQTTFYNLAPGEYTVGIFVVDSAGNTVAGAGTQDYVDRVGIGDYYVTVGDSITQGYGDDDPSDNISLDGRNSGGGFPPILNDLLTQLSGYPHTVINEGISGTTSSQGLLNLPAVLQRHPDAQRVLIKYGMNDARSTLLYPDGVPSGLGLWPGDEGYQGTFKDNVQRMLNLIRDEGKEALIAKINIALAGTADGTPYPDPNNGPRSLRIQRFNQVVDELFAANTDIMFYPPDFYSYFEGLYYDDGYLEEYFDKIHPNGQGYRSMAVIWYDILTLPENRRSDPSGGTGAYLQDSSGMVSVETEHFDAHVPNGGYEWTLDYTSGYSGTGAMKAPGRYYKTGYVENSPRLDYEVRFRFSGPHYLWVRAYATSKSTDSLHAGLNGSASYGGNDIGFAAVGAYVWASTTLTIPSVGVHTVNLWGREPYAVVDKVVLTTDSSYVPSGFGPPESPRE